MKTLYAFTIIAALAAVGCLADDNINTEADDLELVTAPDQPEANIIVPGCDAPETDPYRVCDSNPGGGGGGGGGGGVPGGGSGGGGGICTPGTPGCHGPVNPCPAGQRWNATFGRCVSSSYGQSCVGSGTVLGHICTYDTYGVCRCSPRPCSAMDPCPTGP